jgi:hypothetical protein
MSGRLFDNVHRDDGFSLCTKGGMCFQIKAKKMDRFEP